MSYTRRTLQVLAFLATLMVGVASMAVIVTQTTWFKEWLRGFVVRQAADYVNGNLSIGRLDGNLFFGIDLSDVDVTVNGEKVVDVDDIALDYNAFTLIRGGVVLDEIRLTRPVLRLHRDANGWNLAHLIKARTPDRPQSRRTLEIGEVGINDGTLFVDDGAVGTSGVDMPSRIDKVDVVVGIKSNEDELTVNVDHVSLRAADPSIGINAMSGVIRRTPDEIAFDNVEVRTEESVLRLTGSVSQLQGDSPVVDLKASSDTVAIAELARLIPALRGYELQPAFTVSARGPADRMDVAVSLRDRRLGEVESTIVVDGLAPERRLTGTASVSRLNLVALSRTPTGRPSPLASDISGRARFDLVLPEGSMPIRGTYAVNVGSVRIAGYAAKDVVADGRIDGTTVRVNARGNAYGAHATVAGTVRAGAPLSLDLRGRAANVDLRNLPQTLQVPRASSNLQFAYTLTARGSEFRGTATLEPSTLAGASLAEGTSGAFSFGAGAPTYSAKGQVAGLDVERVGREFNIPAIATERYRSVVNGTFDMSGSGGGRYPLALDVTGTLVDSRMFEAAFPRMDVTTNLSDGNLRVKTAGSFAGLNPAVVTGDERGEGMLSGSVDADTTIRAYAEGVTAESIDVAGRVQLEMSTIGKLSLDSGVVDGRYAGGEAQLTELQITGADVNVTGQGTLALNETGASNLTLHADTPSLDRVGEIIGQSLKGAVVVDTVVTGNRNELKAEGTVKGSDIGYGESEALSLESKFSATIPDLEFSRARVQADSTATFLEVAGQKVNRLTADTTYAESRLEFNAVAQQERRELAAGGSVVLHPDHSEIHIGDLALRSEQIEWRAPAGSAAAIRYGNDRIEVDRLELVNGSQRIEASGALGEGRSMQVHVENIDVAQLDTLLLGDGRLAGQFTGTATITGPTSAPQVTSEFTLAQGAFRTFKFDALTGTVGYTKDGVRMDVRLQQTPEAWLTAKGTAPLTLFQPTPPEFAGHDAAGAGGPVDIEVATSQVDLGIIQGFTPFVMNVTGTMQANFRIAGTGYDPHAEGAIDVRGGAFALPEFGTRYTGLDTRIELGQDLVTVREFKILDSRGFPMTVGGTLAVHERAVGAVDIAIQSENFEVLDNKLADLKLDTQLKITGQVRKPRIEGTVEVENGTVHVTELLEQATASAYATEPTDAGIVEGDAAARATQPAPNAQAAKQEPSVFDALALDIALSVPNNLVLRGNNLRPANAPIEMGDINVTVGGQVRVQKAPGDQMRFTGDVNTVRGSYNFQGRRFDIERDGHIRFDGDDEINPTLNVRARREISSVETFVRVQGTLKQPELSFASNPPLDQADILSLIVFNQPINELAEGQQVSLTERAGALAGGYVASGLARSIGNALELDEFEIQTGESGVSPTLSVGEQIGEHFFFRVRQGFGDAQATELILEYQVKEYLRAVGTIAEPSDTRRETFRRIERGGLDLIFFFSY